jgi:hypothetical protein
MWRELLAFLASVAAAPNAVDVEQPKCRAAVCVAMSSMAKEEQEEKIAVPQEVEEPALVPVPAQADACEDAECYQVDKYGRRYRVTR